MTKAVYNRAKLSFDISGHAGSGPKGSDIICAAVSTLSFTLAEAVQEMHKNTSALHLKLYMNDGDMRISCDPDCGHIEDCRIIFDTIAKGFDLLYEFFPEFLLFIRE